MTTLNAIIYIAYAPKRPLHHSQIYHTWMTWTTIFTHHFNHMAIITKSLLKRPSNHNTPQQGGMGRFK